LQPSLYAILEFSVLLDGFVTKQGFGNIKESSR
jgi:hypothetical protein